METKKRFSFERFWLRVHRYLWLLFLAALAGAGGLAVWLDFSRALADSLPHEVYTHWEPSLLSNALGVMAQIIGFMVTIIVSGVFVVGQYLGERLPQRVVQRFLSGNVILIPVAGLLLVLAYDLGLLYLTHDGFRPLVGVGLIAAVVIFSASFCLYAISQSMQVFNLNAIVKGTRDRAKKALKLIEPSSLNASLDDLEGIVRFCAERGYGGTASLAFGLFLEIAEAWTVNVEGTFDTLTDDRDKAALATAKSTLLDAHWSGIRGAIQHHDAAMFLKVLRLIGSHMSKMPPSLFDAQAKTLTELCAISTELDSKLRSSLVTAAHLIINRGIESGRMDICDVGINMLTRLWGPFGQDMSLRSRVLKAMLMAFTLLQDHLSKPESTERVKAEIASRCSKINGAFIEWGGDILQHGMEPLYRDWLAGLEHLLAYLTKEKDPAAIREGLQLVLQTYVSALASGCEQVYSAIPGLLTYAFRAACTTATDFRLLSDVFLEMAPPGTPDDSMVRLVGLFVAIYEEAIDRGATEIAVKALDVITGFPVQSSLVNNDIFHFLLEKSAVCRDENQSELAREFFRRLVTVLEQEVERGNTEMCIYLLVVVRDYLPSKSLTNAEYMAFLGFCEDIPESCGRRLRELIYETLNEFCVSLRDPEILSAALALYRSLATAAVEEQAEPTVRLGSSFLGQLTYAVINADISLNKKVAFVRASMQWHQRILILARRFKLSWGTLVYLGTFYLVLGATSQELENEVERTTLQHEVLGVMVGIDDTSLLEDALFARTYGVAAGLDPSNGPYFEFWSLYLATLRSQPAAVTVIESDPQA